MVQVHEYLSKAEEFLLAATSELQAERSINAADAVCGARLRRRAAGQDHRETINLLRQAEMMDLNSPKIYSACSP